MDPTRMKQMRLARRRQKGASHGHSWSSAAWGHACSHVRLIRIAMGLSCLFSIAYFYHAYEINASSHASSHASSFSSSFDDQETTRDTSERCRESMICDDSPPTRQSCRPRSSSSDPRGLECITSSEKRQALIVEAASHAYRAYRDHAWGKDEAVLRGVESNSNRTSPQRHSLLGDIGLTMIDSLDTLWLMNLTSEFNEARAWLLDPGPNGYKHALGHTTSRGVSTFEANIRVLGGFLSTFALTSDPAFLDLALDFAERLLPAIDKPVPTSLFLVQNKGPDNGHHGISGSDKGPLSTPLLQYNPPFPPLHIGDSTEGQEDYSTAGNNHPRNIHRKRTSSWHRTSSPSKVKDTDGLDWAAGRKVSDQRNLAEVGTLSMEMTTLSHWTGRDEFGDAGLRFFREAIKSNQGIAPKDGLQCNEMKLNPSQSIACDGFKFSFGACADSYYEYLLKQWILSGDKIGDTFIDMREAYVSSIHGLRKHLLTKVSVLKSTLLKRPRPRAPYGQLLLSIKTLLRLRVAYYLYVHPILLRLSGFFRLPWSWFAAIWPAPKHTDHWIVTSGKGSLSSPNLYEEQDESLMEVTREYDLEHLTCFVPGLLTLGHLYGINTALGMKSASSSSSSSSSVGSYDGQMLDEDVEGGDEDEREVRYREDDLKVAQRLTSGCYQLLYGSTPTGLGLDWIRLEERKSLSTFLDLAVARGKANPGLLNHDDHNHGYGEAKGAAGSHTAYGVPRLGRRKMVSGRREVNSDTSRRRLLTKGTDPEGEEDIPLEVSPAARLAARSDSGSEAGSGAGAAGGSQGRGSERVKRDKVYRTITPISSSNFQRPEVLESLFYLHRATGDPIYREWGWSIFRSIDRWLKLPGGGYVTAEEVKSLPPLLGEKMESFFIAETLKYLFLLFSDDPQMLPLDKWVLNTEAHPLPIWGSEWDEKLLQFLRLQGYSYRKDQEQNATR